MKIMTIGQLAAAAGVGIDTVRNYERSRLLSPAARRASGYREYGESELRRLRFIRGAKQLGFTLEAVRTLLEVMDGDGDRAVVLTLASQRLAEIDRKLSEIQLVRAYTGRLEEQS